MKSARKEPHGVWTHVNHPSFTEVIPSPDPSAPTAIAPNLLKNAHILMAHGLFVLNF